MVFRSPEMHGTLSPVSMLDGAAVADGKPLSAGVLREAIRNANTQVSREHLVFRWVSRARQVAVEVTDPTYGLASVPPNWTAPIPIPPSFPVPKKFGARALRARIQANITNARVIDFFFGTSVQSDPARASQGQIATLAGVGDSTIYEVEDILCREGDGELLTLAYRARTDPSADDLLDTGTFGGVSSGVIDSAPTLYSITDTGAAWNATGAGRVHLGGYYLVVYDNAGAIVHGPAEIRALGPSAGGTTDQLFFWPPARSQAQLIHADYEIRQLPQAHLPSIAIYTQERNA